MGKKADNENKKQFTKAIFNARGLTSEIKQVAIERYQQVRN